MSNLLAIETATEACSLALSVGDRIHSRHVIAGRDQTAVLLPLLHELMAEGQIGFSELDGVVCGVGPGSFAGVRVGVGFVKGLALVRDLPIVPILSLASLAQGAMRRTGHVRILSCIDARMGEVYVGAYERDAHRLARPVDTARVCKPENVTMSLQSPWVATGTGWGSYSAVLCKALGAEPAAEEPDALPEAVDALALGKLAFAAGQAIALGALEPVYLRNDVALTLEQQAEARRIKSTTRKEVS